LVSGIDEAKWLTDLEFNYLRMEPEDRSEVLERLKAFLAGVDGVVFAYVHGGFVESGAFRDTDVAAWVRDPENAFDYAVSLSAKCGREVEVPVDMHVLNGAPLPFKHHVFKSGRLLFSKDEELRLKMLDEALRQYFDLELLRRG